MDPNTMSLAGYLGIFALFAIGVALFTARQARIVSEQLREKNRDL